jgi:phosphoenolpyruvate-protein kinase (PTS system EI component)
VAVGTAYCLHEIYVDPDTKRLEDREVTAELARYETARDKTASDLAALQRKVESQVGHEAAAIFTVHESILYDAAFTKKIRDWIVYDRLSASAALHRLLTDYTTLFERTADEYLKERVNDVRDVVVRLSVHLSEVPAGHAPALSGPLIVVADELLPSQAVALGKIEVSGIVTQAGSQTSHAAIIAPAAAFRRSRASPAF